MAGPLKMERLRDAVALLEEIAADRSLLSGIAEEDRTRFLRALDMARNPTSRTRRRLARAAQRVEKAARVTIDRQQRAATGIRIRRQKPAFTTPNVFPPEGFEPRDVHEPDRPGVSNEPRPGREGGAAGPADAQQVQACYICKRRYTTIHHFYDQLCPSCAELNFAKRTELADLAGRVALVTGGRVKIGYEAGLKLLRAGASLVVTTRFPRDAAMRYAREPDFEAWRERLEIAGLDLRHTPSVETFCRHLLTRDRLDFIVNNACQTVRRPPEFYAHMMAAETAALGRLPAHARKLLIGDGDRGLGVGDRGDREFMIDRGDIETEERMRQWLPTPDPRSPIPDPRVPNAALLSQVALLPDESDQRPHLFPPGQLDADLQQVDLRQRNSWRLLLADVSSVELLEVHLVNAVAPFVLNARLKALMLRTPERDKHIVNVSAMEGQFYRPFKTTRHPHTNMAKAALNMLTRTAAADYQADGIHMNSVDTGWVTDEDPLVIAERKRTEQGFHPPLDSLDGAARIVDPIISGFNTGQHVWGQFLKDYRPTDW